MNISPPETGFGWLGIAFVLLIILVLIIEKVREYQLRKDITKFEKMLKPCLENLLSSANASRTLEQVEFPNIKQRPVSLNMNVAWPNYDDLFDLSFAQRRENNARHELGKLSANSPNSSSLPKMKLDLVRLEIFTQIAKIGHINPKAAYAAIKNLKRTY